MKSDITYMVTIMSPNEGTRGKSGLEWTQVMRYLRAVVEAGIVISQVTIERETGD